MSKQHGSIADRVTVPSTDVCAMCGRSLDLAANTFAAGRSVYWLGVKRVCGRCHDEQVRRTYAKR